MKDARAEADTSAGEDYLTLARRFPLSAVQVERDYTRAGKVLNRLLGRPGGKLSAGERDYLNALVLLVEDYERKHAQMIFPRPTPYEALKFVAEQSGMGPTALAKVLGTTHAMASLMLSGKRGISAQAARTLAAHFKVDAGLFI